MAICVDGAVVLAGSVLTAYVGVAGLVRRLALDRVLPSAFERPRWIVAGFFSLTASLFLVLTRGGGEEGQLSDLGGVYALVRGAVSVKVSQGPLSPAPP